MTTKTQEIYLKAKESGKVSDRIPWLELGKKQEGGGVKPTGKHIVKFLSDKIVKGQDYHTKKERKEVEFLFEENGVQKRYRVSVLGKDDNLHYLLETMKQFEYGDTLIMEMKWAGDKHIIVVEKVIDEVPVINEDEIPIIENGDNVEDNLEEEAELPF